MMGLFTYLDLALLAVCFISGLLALYRGFARELLSILSWAAAGAAAYWIYNRKELSTDFAAATGLPEQYAGAAIAAIVALIVLIIVHLITVRMSDAILDSNIGMIDRILGFAFGVLRGFLLFVIPYMAYESFVTPEKEKQHPHIGNAYFRDYLKSTGEAIRNTILYAFPEQFNAAPPGEQQGFLNDQRQLVALVSKGERYYMSVPRKA